MRAHWTSYLRAGTLVALLAALGCASGWVITELREPVFAASSTVLVLQTQPDRSVNLDDINASRRITRSYAVLAGSPDVLRAAIAALPDSGLSLQDLADRVEVEGILGTQLVRITVEASDAERAAEQANAVTEALTVYFAELSVRGGSPFVLPPPIEVIPAVPPPEAVRPSLSLNLILGTTAATVVGLLGGASIIVRDDRITSIADVGRLGLPILATIPKLAQPRGPELTGRSRSGAGNDVRLDDVWQQARVSLSYAFAAHRAKVVVVLSPRAREGRSLVALNLGLALAASGEQVVLVDGDSRGHGLTAEFGGRDRTEGSAPISAPDDLETQRDLPTLAPGLTFLGAEGGAPNFPARGLAAGAQRVLSGPYERVLVDAGPATAQVSSSPWLQRADAAIIVARRGRSRLDEVALLAHAIAETKTPILGIIYDAG